MNREFRTIRAVFCLLGFCLAAFPSKDAFAQNCGPGVRACIQALGFLPGTENAASRSSAATAISADGTTVVGTARNADQYFEAFRWVNGAMTGLGKMPGTGICVNQGSCSGAAGVSGDGAIVVGTAPVSGGPFDGTRPLPFRWTNGTMAPIMPTACPQYNAANDYGYATMISADGSTIVGTLGCSSTGNTPKAYRSVNGSMSLLDYSSVPNATLATPAAVSASGSAIVGGINVPNADPVPVRWTDGIATAIAKLPNAPHNSPSAVTPDGKIIFGSSDPGGGCCIAVRWNTDTDVRFMPGPAAAGASANGVTVAQDSRWTSRDGFKDVRQLLIAAGVNLSQWESGTRFFPTGVSADGMTLTGSATDLNGKNQAFIARLPLPAFHDFDADTRSDILWRDTSAGTIALWLMNGTAIQQNLGIGSAPTNWSVVGQRDFNGDGKHDILWRDTSGNIAMWLMNGGTIQTNASLGSVPSTWSVAGTGDFDGDGKADILWRESITGNIALWLMNGTTIQQNINVGSVPPSWSVAGVADFNGDGEADILWRDTSGNIAMWLMNGGAILQSLNIGTVPTSYAVAGTGDFNGDGKADLVWRENSTGSIALWLMNGGAIQTNANLGSVPTSWSIAETGDFNGDGKSDLLWRESSTGNIAMWLMNGTTVQQNANVGSVPTNWAIQGAAAD